MNQNAQRPESGGAGIRNKFIALFSRSDDPMVRLRQKMLLQGAVFVCVCLVIVGVLFGMTAAWYTNVVKSEALTVQAAAWGFDAEVTGTSISATPGDSGDLSGFTIVNNSELPVRVLAQVDKTATDNNGEYYMPVEMQKRVYFYTEDENHAATWLSSDNGYLFEMGGSGTADAENHPLDEKALGDIHWLWVYDLVGYYVRCSVTLDNGVYVIQELEYLSPIVYDPYDPGTEYDVNGEPVKIEGANLNTYLDGFGDVGAEITNYSSQFPGFENYSRYYLIGTPDIESGTVVLLYLLDKGEIEAATAYDTAAADPQTPLSFTPTLVFTGENITTP